MQKQRWEYRSQGSNGGNGAENSAPTALLRTAGSQWTPPRNSVGSRIQAKEEQASPCSRRAPLHLGAWQEQDDKELLRLFGAMDGMCKLQSRGEKGSHNLHRRSWKRGCHKFAGGDH